VVELISRFVFGIDVLCTAWKAIAPIGLPPLRILSSVMSRLIASAGGTAIASGLSAKAILDRLTIVGSTRSCETMDTDPGASRR
jgi:hypothetical protein